MIFETVVSGGPELSQIDRYLAMAHAVTKRGAP